VTGVFDRVSSFHVGQVVRITDPDLNTAHADVTVMAVGAGNRVTVSYGDVATLTLPAHMLAPVQAYARTTDPFTSHLAAGSQTPERLSAGQRTVLAALVNAGRRGLTDFELSDRTGSKQTSHGKRRGELVRHGLVVDAGLTRPSDTGVSAKVWRVTDLGVEVWRRQLGGAA
jgi:hypothetical protein